MRHMETATRKRALGAMVLALFMLFYGVLMTLYGYFTLSEWRWERVALMASGLLWILTGPVIFGSGLWVCVSLGRGRFPLRIGGIAVLVSGAVLATVAPLGVLPCSGPA